MKDQLQMKSEGEGQTGCSSDSGLSALLIMAALHGIAADEAMLRHEFGHEPLFHSKDTA